MPLIQKTDRGTPLRLVTETQRESEVVVRGDNKLKAYYFFILSLSVIHRAILISMPPKKLSPQKISPQKASVQKGSPQKGSPQETSSSNDMIILIYFLL